MTDKELIEGLEETKGVCFLRVDSPHPQDGWAISFDVNASGGTLADSMFYPGTFREALTAALDDLGTSRKAEMKERGL